jgi:drug/metabolite transporter (DMT)-like permease
LLLKQHHPPPSTRNQGVVIHSATPQAGGRLARIGPALLGASSFACGDVLSKIVLLAGADALTASLARGVVGVALLFAWRQLVPGSAPFAPRARTISLCLGVLFAGNIFLLFKAIETVEVPIAILTYFVYPLLTGLAGAATGLDKVTWRGGVAALAAFFGLALMIGAHPTALAMSGILAALGAALCRVGLLLVTRAMLQDADPLRITWYSLASSSALLAVAALVTLNWQPPSGATGWLALLALSVAVTTGLLGVFGSTMRIGPFRTALFMNLEPLLATIGSALFLGEVITPLQAVGGLVMIGALVAFQLRR